MNKRKARVILAGVDSALKKGTELLKWWNENEGTDRIEPIPAARQPNSSDWNYGFLTDIPLEAGIIPALGVSQGMFYDRPKAPTSYQRESAEWYRDQVREFMMGYFMSVSSSVDVWRSSPAGDTGSRTPEKSRLPTGWRYKQLFFKELDTGAIGEFPSEEQYDIVDLRLIGTKYEWVIFKVHIFEFSFIFDLLGLNGPRVEVPVSQDVFVVMNRDFVMNRDAPEPGVLGSYGYGYAIITVPDPDSIIAYAPSTLVTGFETIHFRVLENGEVRVKMDFVVNQPRQMLNLRPIDWGLELADDLSGGMASRLLAPLAKFDDLFIPDSVPVLFPTLNMLSSLTGGLTETGLCMSRRRILIYYMALHFFWMYQFILGTLPTWNSVPDWLDEKSVSEELARSGP